MNQKRKEKRRMMMIEIGLDGVTLRLEERSWKLDHDCVGKEKV